MKINEVIRKYRKEQNLTQEQVANFLGVTPPAVNKWESGASYPDIMLLAPLARILKIDVDTLLSFNEELTDVEINHIIEEISEDMTRCGYDKSFKKGADYIKSYAKCNKLILFIAQILDMYLFEGEENSKEKYEKSINSWFETVAFSGEGELSNMALISLCKKNMSKSDYENAQKLLDKIPPLGVDKRSMEANLQIEQENYDSAYEIYEKIIYEKASSLISSLMSISNLKCKEKNYEDALYFSRLCEVVGDTFDLGAYTSNFAEFVVAIEMKDRSMSLGVLRKIVDNLDKHSTKESRLYSHMKFKEDFDSDAIKNMIKRSLEVDKSVDFLRGDVEFINLMDRLK